MNNYSKKIAITTGDPNGIGAEITIKALNKLDLPEDKIVLVSNKKILDFYGHLNATMKLLKYLLMLIILNLEGLRLMPVIFLSRLCKRFAI